MDGGKEWKGLMWMHHLCLMHVSSLRVTSAHHFTSSSSPPPPPPPPPSPPWAHTWLLRHYLRKIPYSMEFCYASLWIWSGLFCALIQRVFSCFCWSSTAWYRHDTCSVIFLDLDYGGMLFQQFKGFQEKERWLKCKCLSKPTYNKWLLLACGLNFAAVSASWSFLIQNGHTVL